MARAVVDHESAEDLLSEIVAPRKRRLNLSGERVLYRGMISSLWELVPSAFRTDKREELHDLASAPFWKSWARFVDDADSQRDIEGRAILRFYRECHRAGLPLPRSARLDKMVHERTTWESSPSLINYGASEDWIPGDLLEVAALAQHYGVPTRLLDWTLDPFVACFFAASKPTIGQNLSIWELVPSEALHEPDFPLIIVSPPYVGNQNLAAQQGVFTLIRDPSRTGKLDRRPLDERMDEGRSADKGQQGFLRQHNLRASERLNLLKLLFDLGYGTARVFPGYKSVVAQMRSEAPQSPPPHHLEFSTEPDC